MTTNELDLTADVIDVREIIERVEDLEAECADEEDTICKASDEDRKELATLTAILDDLKGNGGDEQWRGDWYPVTLIREEYFTDYIQELIGECYEFPAEMHKGWPFNHLTMDWESAADEAKYDYTSTEIDGVTYFYR